MKTLRTLLAALACLCCVGAGAVHAADESEDIVLTGDAKCTSCHD